MCQLLSCVRLFVTPWTVARQASLSIGFSRQEYWSGVPFLSPGDLPDPRSNPGLLYYRQILYHLSHPGSLAYSNLRSGAPPTLEPHPLPFFRYSLSVSFYLPLLPWSWPPPLHQPTSCLFFSLASRLGKGSSVAQTFCVISDPSLAL